MKSKTNAFETALQRLRGGSVVNEAADLRESIEALHQMEKIYFVSYPVGMGGAASVKVSEIYPGNVQGLAGSICSIVACLAGWIVSYTFNFLMEWSSSERFS